MDNEAIKTLVGLFHKPDEEPLSIWGVFALALLATTCGFLLFIYFITLGYGMSVAIPLSVALYSYNAHSPYSMPMLTTLHTSLTIAWAWRLAIFLMHRELINYPQIHQKMVEKDKKTTMKQRLLLWIALAAFYTTMNVPCLYRLQAAFEGEPYAEWGPFGAFAVLIQLTGLVLETIGDYQKTHFKSKPGNRDKWCNQGLWSLSTHPNYLGEILLWTGTYFGGMASYQTVIQWCISTLGFIFIAGIMQWAVKDRTKKNFKQYGHNPEFVKFRETHCLIGPFKLFDKSPKPIKKLQYIESNNVLQRDNKYVHDAL